MSAIIKFTQDNNLNLRSGGLSTGSPLKSSHTSLHQQSVGQEPSEAISGAGGAAASAASGAAGGAVVRTLQPPVVDVALALRRVTDTLGPHTKVVKAGKLMPYLRAEQQGQAGAAPAAGPGAELVGA